MRTIIIGADLALVVTKSASAAGRRSQHISASAFITAIPDRPTNTIRRSGYH
jgi:hypothetical protein